MGQVHVISMELESNLASLLLQSMTEMSIQLAMAGYSHTKGM